MLLVLILRTATVCGSIGKYGFMLQHVPSNILLYALPTKLAQRLLLNHEG